MAASDKHQPSANVTEFLDRRLNGPNEHRLVAVRHKPIGKFDPDVHIRFRRPNVGAGTDDAETVTDTWVSAVGADPARCHVCSVCLLHVLNGPPCVPS